MGFLGTPTQNVRGIPYCNHTNYGALIRQVNVLWKNDPTPPDYEPTQNVVRLLINFFITPMLMTHKLDW